MLVRDVLKRDVATIGPGASLAVAARMARDQDVGCLPVVEGGRLIGMITDRDIVVRGVAEGLEPERTTVREAMSTHAVACSVEHTVDQAGESMAVNLIKHLPVLDRSECRRRRVAQGHHRTARKMPAASGDVLQAACDQLR